MAIRLLKSREINASTASLILEEIELGEQVHQIVARSNFYRNLRITSAIGGTIRACNNALGMSGNFKNGCLYRESKLAEFWKKGEDVVCDHAIPVRELARKHVEENIPLHLLAFSPVVRLSKESNDALTKLGYAKKGHKEGYPLFRYSYAEISIVTHHGDPIDPTCWTDEDHWSLIRSTEELEPVLKALKIS